MFIANQSIRAKAYLDSTPLLPIQFYIAVCAIGQLTVMAYNYGLVGTPAEVDLIAYIFQQSEIKLITFYNPNTTSQNIILKIGPSIVKFGTIAPKKTLVYANGDFNDDLKKNDIAFYRYIATTAGTGYSIGDWITNIVTFDDTGAVISNYWYNLTTPGPISIPPNSDIKDISYDKSLESTQVLVKGVLDNIKLKTDNLDVTLSSRLNTLGQKLMSGSTPVTIASDQTPIPISGTVTTTPPTNYALETGGVLDSIKLKTDNLDVALSTRLKPSDTLTKVTTLDTITNPVAVTGTFFQATQPVSAVSLPLPSGAAIAANQQTDALTDAQLRATPVPISGTITTGGLTDTQLRASAVPISLAVAPTTPVTGTFFQATQPVSLTTLPSGTNNIGDVDVVSSILPTGASTETTLSALNTKVPSGLTVTAGKLQVELPAGGSGLTDAELRATPVPISGTVTTNAGTNLNTSLLALEAGGNLASIKAKTDNIPPLGQALAAASTPVVLTAIQQAALTPPAAITGFATSAKQDDLLTELQLKADLTETQPVSVAALPLPTGASTSAKQDLLLTELQLKADLTETQPISAASLPLPSGASTSGKQDSGNTSVASIDTKTPALGQALAASSVPVVLTAAQVTTLTPPAAISGFNLEATQLLVKAKTDNLDVLLSTRLKPADTLTKVATVDTITNVVHIDDNAGSITVDGSVTANAGTNLNTSALALSATQTDGTQKSIVRGGAKGTTTAADITSTAQSTDRQALDVQIRTSAGVVVDTFGGGTQFADGAARGTATGTLLMVDDGTNIQSALGTTAGVLKVDLSATTANATAVKVDGSAVTQPVSNAGLTNIDVALSTRLKPADTLTKVATVDTITNVVHVDDNASSLTVDAPVATPVFVRLSDGSAAIATLPVSLATNTPTLQSGSTTTVTQATGTNLHVVVDSAPSTAVTNAGTFAVQATPVTQADTFMLGAVNVKEFNGVTPLMGAGNGGTGSQRVNIASDQVSIPTAATLTAETTKVIGTINISAAQTIAAVTAITNALPAGTNLLGKVGIDQVTANANEVVLKASSAVIGALTANQSVNVAQFGGTTVVNGGVAGLQAIGGNVANAVTATSNPVPVGGIYTTTPATLTTGQTATLQFNSVQNAKVTLSGKLTYRASAAAVLVPAVTADKPWLVIYGSSTKTIKVQRIIISGLTLTAVQYLNIGVAKYSTAPSGGTATTFVQIPLNSTSAAATASLVQGYTTVPTTGTRIGFILSTRVLGQATVAAAAGITDEYVFDFRCVSENDAVALNGTAQGIGLEWIATVPASTVSMMVYIEWTEE